MVDLPLQNAKIPFETPPISDNERCKRRRKATHKLSRKRKREEAATSFQVERVRKKIDDKYIRKTKTRKCNLHFAQDIEVAKGAYVGSRKEKPFPKDTFMLEQLVGPSSEGFALLPWDGM